MVCQDDNRNSSISNCPLNIRPNSTAACCHFKWRNLWTPVRLAFIFFFAFRGETVKLNCVVCSAASFQCSVSCGMGTRSRQLVCMRMYPRNGDEKQPRRKGQQVDKSNCAFMKQPPLVPKTKSCRKQCAQPKWENSPWSRVSPCPIQSFFLSLFTFYTTFNFSLFQCSVGCGQGYASREVKCLINGQVVNDVRCRGSPKPIKTRHCETTTECKWKVGPWKAVSHNT